MYFTKVYKIGSFKYLTLEQVISVTNVGVSQLMEKSESNFGT